MTDAKTRTEKNKLIQSRCQLPPDKFLGVFALHKSLPGVIANTIQNILNVSWIRKIITDESFNSLDL